MHRIVIIPVVSLIVGCSLPLNGENPFLNSEYADARPDGPHDRSDAGLLPINGDLPQANAVCHAPLSVGYMSIPIPAACKTLAIPSGLEQTVNYFDVNGPGSCEIKEAPPSCAACDYTCDCFLELNPKCECTQGAVGGPILLSGCP
jgi:hypothetical protein